MIPVQPAVIPMPVIPPIGYLEELDPTNPEPYIFYRELYWRELHWKHQEDSYS